MSVASAKMPAAVVSGVVCLLLGVAGGVVIGGVAGNPLQETPTVSEDDGGSPDGENGESKGEGKGGGAKGGGGKGGGGGGRGGRGPSPKAQLTQLVTKIDQVSAQPLKIDLTSEQKVKMKNILAGLDAKEELSDEEAKAKFDELIKAVEGNKETLEAAGYRWPGTPFQRPGESPPNPFKEGEPATHLKSLEATVAK